MKFSIFFVLCIVFVASGHCDFSSISYDDYDSAVAEYGKISLDTSLISKMIERGKIIVKSIPKIGIKLAGRVWNFIPTPETIFNLSKQTLLGLPQQVIAYAIDKFCECLHCESLLCVRIGIRWRDLTQVDIISILWSSAIWHNVGSAAIHLKVITPNFTPSVHLMNFELLTHNGENITIPLLEPHRLWQHSKFHQDWDIVLLVTGWNSNINETNDAVDSLYAAYRERDVNFVVHYSIQFLLLLADS